MRAVGALLRFVYDLVVGDSWPLTAAMVIVIGAGAFEAHAALLPPALLAVCVALAAMVVAPAVVVIEARAATRRGGR